MLLQLRGDRLGFLERSARRYGDFVPFKAGAWRYLLVNDPDFIREVLVTQAGLFTKGPALQRAGGTLGRGLLTSEGELHRRQRRLAQPAFHPSRVAAYAADMTRIAAAAGDAFRDGESIDMHERMMALTLRIVAKTLFDAEVESEVAELGRAMDITVGMFSRAMAPWGPLLNRLPLPSNFRFRAARATLFSTIERLIAQRRTEQREGVLRRDLLSTLVRARDGAEAAEMPVAATADAASSNGAAGDGMSDAQLRDESLTIFTAGHETTANALTFAWCCLAKNPECDALLRRELKEVVGDRLPIAEDLDQLPYTRAVIAEAMRLFPPAWAVARQAKQECAILGHSVAAGEIVLMSQWVTHRDPRWWPDPERFDPSRWLDGAAAAAADRPRYAYYPFGGGPRVCIGEAFAWSEAMLVLATLARRWRATVIGRGEMKLNPTITLRPRNPVMMRLERRSPAL